MRQVTAHFVLGRLPRCMTRLVHSSPQGQEEAQHSVCVSRLRQSSPQPSPPALGGTHSQEGGSCGGSADSALPTYWLRRSFTKAGGHVGLPPRVKAGEGEGVTAAPRDAMVGNGAAAPPATAALAARDATAAALAPRGRLTTRPAMGDGDSAPDAAGESPDGLAATICALRAWLRSHHSLAFRRQDDESRALR